MRQERSGRTNVIDDKKGGLETRPYAPIVILAEAKFRLLAAANQHL